MGKGNDYEWLSVVPYVDIFLQYFGRNKSAKTIRNYQRELARFFIHLQTKYKGEFNEIDVTTFTRMRTFGNKIEYLPIRSLVIKEFLEAIPSLQHRERSRTVLRRFFRFLMEKREVDVNPVRKKPYYRRKAAPKQGPAVETILRLIEYVQQEVEQPYRGALMTQMCIGIRVGALLQLRDDDLTRSNDHYTLHVSPSIQKNRRESIKPLPDIHMTLEAYLAWRKTIPTDSDLLFVDANGTPLTPQWYNQRLAQISQSIEVEPKLTSHDLRRGAATLLAAPCLDDLEGLRRLLDHKDTATTENYVRRSTVEELRSEIKQLPVTNTVASFHAKWIPPKV